LRIFSSDLIKIEALLLASSDTESCHLAKHPVAINLNFFEETQTTLIFLTFKWQHTFYNLTLFSEQRFLVLQFIPRTTVKFRPLLVDLATC
jgi:hypothetical protein